MSQENKNRMIDLLIKASDEAGDSEGVWFLEKNEAMELCGLLMEHDPRAENVRNRKKQLEWLQKDLLRPCK